MGIFRQIDEMVHFDESMYRNHLANDTTARSASTALDGNLNDQIIREQGNPGATGRPPAWCIEARRVHDHLYHGHVSAAVEALVDARKAGGELGFDDSDKSAAIDSCSTFERLLDGRACTMEFSDLHRAARQLDEFCYFRDDVRSYGVNSDRFIRARNVLRGLAGHNAMQAATELGFVD